MLATLVAKEWRTWLRSRAPFAGLTLLSLAFAALTLLALWPVVASLTVRVPSIGSAGPSSGSTLGGLLAAQRGLFIFTGLGLAVLAAAAVVAPAVGSTAVTGERRAETWEAIVLTGVGTGRLLLGKLLAASGLVLLLLATAVPAFAAAWAFGGVSPAQAASAVLVVVATVLGFTAIGVFCSALARTPPLAALYAYAAVFLLAVGTIALAVLGESLGWGERTRLLLHLNPFAALLTSGGAAVEQALASAPVPLRQSLAPQATEALGLSLRYPLWSAQVAIYLALAAVLTALGGLLADPVARLPNGSGGDAAGRGDAATRGPGPTLTARESA